MKLQELINRLIECNDDKEIKDLINQINLETKEKIFHGSIVSNLKKIEARASTQKGKYVYGTPNFVYAVIFAIISKTGSIFPLKFGGLSGNIYLAETRPNQFDYVSNLRVSVYRLNDENFYDFDNHSAGKDVEVRADGDQKVFEEIVVNNPLLFLKKLGVKLYSYDERDKAGIPLDDKYLIQGALKTYCWKIEDGTEEGFKHGKEQIELIKREWNKYNKELDLFVSIIDRLPIDKRLDFVNNVYDRENGCFNDQVINDTLKYLKGGNSNVKSSYAL